MGVRLAVAGFVLVAAACSSGQDATPLPSTTTSAADRAIAACRDGATGRFVNARATTVGEIHAITGGPLSASGLLHPWRNVLATEPDKAFAAWCWERDGGTYTSYVVGPGGQVVHTGASTGSKPEPGPLPVT
jgi:hypothetical protein